MVEQAAEPGHFQLVERQPVHAFVVRRMDNGGVSRLGGRWAVHQRQELLYPIVVDEEPDEGSPLAVKLVAALEAVGVVDPGIRIPEIWIVWID